MSEVLTEIPSTVIDNDAMAPGGAEYRPDIEVAPEVEAEKPMSLEDALKQAASETKEKAEKAEDPKAAAKEEKAKPEVKEEPKAKTTPERGENGKFTAKAPAEADQEPSGEDGVEGEQEPEAKRPSEGRDINKAPAHFLPRAKEKWATVDPDVKGEVYRTIENLEKGLEQSKEDREFRKSIRQYEEMATQAKTTVPEAMERYTRIDQELQRNPENGIKAVLATIGLTPEKYAQHILQQAQFRQQNPDAAKANDYQAQLQQVQQQLEAERQAKAELEEQARIASLERDFVTPFRNNPDYPRFDELEQDIAKLLKSGIVSFDKPERSRIEEAYYRADRMNPDSREYEDEPRKPANSAQRPLNPAGSKSVKGSLSYGAETPRKSAKLSLDEAIKMAARSVHG